MFFLLCSQQNTNLWCFPPKRWNFWRPKFSTSATGNKNNIPLSEFTAKKRWHYRNYWTAKAKIMFLNWGVTPLYNFEVILWFSMIFRWTGAIFFCEYLENHPDPNLKMNFHPKQGSPTSTPKSTSHRNPAYKNSFFLDVKLDPRKVERSSVILIFLKLSWTPLSYSLFFCLFLLGVNMDLWS